MGTRPVKRRPRRLTPTDDLGEVLAGAHIEIGTSAYTVERKLKQHDDRSFAFLATEFGSQREVVVRTFDRQSKALDALATQSEGLQGKRGVAAYEGYGSFVVRATRSTSAKGSLTLHGLVRPYAQSTLGDLNHTSGITSGKAIEVLRDVARGIQILHHSNIVIGDLKPTNVLLTNNYDALIADYGLGLPGSDFDDTGFRAPEQLASKSDTGRRTKAADVYSFGKIARFLDSALVDAEEAPNRDRLHAAISKCLELEPSRRPKIDELVEELFGTPALRVRPFRHLVPAAVADFDARMNSHQRPALSEIADSAEQIAVGLEAESRHLTGYRLRELTRSERMHFLATLTMLSTWLVTGPTPGLSVPAMTAIGPPDEWFSSRLDPLWEESLRQSFSLPSADEVAEIEELRGFLPEADIDRMLGTGADDADFTRVYEKSIQARNDLLRRDTYVRSEDVSARMSIACPGITTDEVRILRDLGYLLAVPIAGKSIYPMFQFAGEYALPHSSIRAVNDRFKSPTSTMWGVLGWWWRRNRYLGDVAPAQYLRGDGNAQRITRALTAADAA